jgi:hypothetical protein
MESCVDKLVEYLCKRLSNHGAIISVTPSAIELSGDTRRRAFGNKGMKQAEQQQSSVWVPADTTHKLCRWITCPVEGMVPLVEITIDEIRSLFTLDGDRGSAPLSMEGMEDCLCMTVGATNALIDAGDRKGIQINPITPGSPTMPPFVEIVRGPASYFRVHATGAWAKRRDPIYMTVMLGEPYVSAYQSYTKH